MITLIYFSLKINYVIVLLGHNCFFSGTSTRRNNNMMTSAEYIESLRKLNTKVYMFGEKIDNWVDHPIIKPSISCVAMTYSLAQNPEYEDLMTATSHLTGKKINRFTPVSYTHLTLPTTERV